MCMIAINYQQDEIAGSERNEIHEEPSGSNR
jgi:hypothetical protein